MPLIHWVWFLGGSGWFCDWFCEFAIFWCLPVRKIIEKWLKVIWLGNLNRGFRLDQCDQRTYCVQPEVLSLSTSPRTRMWGTKLLGSRVPINTLVLEHTDTNIHVVYCFMIEIARPSPCKMCPFNSHNELLMDFYMSPIVVGLLIKLLYSRTFAFLQAYFIWVVCGSTAVYYF